MRGRIGVGCAIAVLTVGVLAAPAMACGGLVGENGTIQLVRTATLAAYHDGVERYVTSFEFIGEGEEVGSIVPLPDVPTNVERGGDWTLQRLAREVAPPVEDGDAWRSLRMRRATPRCCSRPRSTRSTSPSSAAGATRSADGRSSTASSSAPTHPRCSTTTQPAARSSWRRVSTPLGPGPRPAERRRHADHAHDPDRRAVGPDPHPGARPRQEPDRRRRRVHAHRRQAEAAGRRSRASVGAQRAGEREPLGGPALRQGHGVDSRLGCGSPTCECKRLPAISGTTSRSRHDRTSRRR